VGSFVLPLLLFLGIWELVSYSGIVKAVLIPPPSRILPRMIELLGTPTKQGGSVLLSHIYASLYRLLFGYTAGALTGVFLGLAMGSNRFVDGYFHPIISVLMPVPGITWAPILVLVLGFGDPTLVTVTFIASFFPVVYNTSAGVRSIKEDHLRAARMMGAGRMALFLKVLLPSSAPQILTGLKLGLARGWRTLIAVEMIASTLVGIGYMTIEAREYLRTDDIFLGIIIIAIIFAVIERSAFNLAEKRTIERWGMASEIV
jgi:ABC-type nitrate/sulfonate/bicarbonate transport system permease component